MWPRLADETWDLTKQLCGSGPNFRWKAQSNIQNSTSIRIQDIILISIASLFYEYGSLHNAIQEKEYSKGKGEA